MGHVEEMPTRHSQIQLRVKKRCPGNVDKGKRIIGTLVGVEV